MKKFWAFTASVLLMLFLAACGEEVHSPGDANGGTMTPKASAPATVGEEEPGFLGVLEGNTYQNTSLGFSCTLPESFRYSTAQELLKKNGLDAEADIALLENMASGCQPTQIMCALDQENHQNILLTFQRATAGELAEKDLKADLQSQLEGDVTGFEAMGLTDVGGEYTRLTADGKALDAVVLTGKTEEREIVSVTVQYKCSEGLVTITMNGTRLQALEKLLEGIRLTDVQQS